MSGWKTAKRLIYLLSNSNGRDKDPSCSPYEHTDAYCTAFKLAYEAQWASMWVQYDCSSGVYK
jgi:hypothetical protein